jgi:predicted RNA-binding Zn ribbon-like protein
VALREAIFRVFLAFSLDLEPPAEDLGVLNAALGRALVHRRLVRGKGCCALGWEEAPAALDAMLWPVAGSAAELLVSDRDLGLVRVCGLHDNQECSWLFLDETRSHTRRWCTMKDCGNRAKARRHYQKVRGA